MFAEFRFSLDFLLPDFNIRAKKTTFAVFIRVGALIFQKFVGLVVCITRFIKWKIPFSGWFFS